MTSLDLRIEITPKSSASVEDVPGERDLIRTISHGLESTYSDCEVEAIPLDPAREKRWPQTLRRSEGLELAGAVTTLHSHHLEHCTDIDGEEQHKWPGECPIFAAWENRR